MNEQSSGLMDIIEPAAPDVVASSQWQGMAAALVLMAFLVISLLLLWKKKWPAYRAVKKLRKLQQQIVTGTVSLQDGVILLNQELRQGLRLAQQLPKEAPQFFKQQDKLQWYPFLQQLDTLRYEAEAALTVAQVNAIADQIAIWLRRYCR